MFPFAVTPPTWPEVVERLSDPDGRRWTAEEEARALDALCAAGDARGCALRSAGLEGVFRDGCRQGESWSCLGLAWGRGDSASLCPVLPADPLAPGLPTDPAAGRACVGRLWTLWRGEHAGMRIRGPAERLCGMGVGEACTLLGALDHRTRPSAAEAWFARAEALGAGAWGVRAELDPTELHLREACEDGVGEACLVWALKDRPQQGPRLARGCALGHREACLEGWLVDPPFDLAERLADACDGGLARACVQAGYQADVGQVFPWPEAPVDAEETRWWTEHSAFAYAPCLRGQLDRGGPRTLSGTLWTRVDAQRRVVGVTARLDHDDPDTRACLVERLVGLELERPREGTGELQVPIDLSLGLELFVGTTRGPSDPLERVGQGARADEEALVRCLAGRGLAEDDRHGLIQLEVTSRGDLRPRVLESLGDPEADACVLARLHGGGPSERATGVLHVVQWEERRGAR